MKTLFSILLVLVLLPGILSDVEQEERLLEHLKGKLTKFSPPRDLCNDSVHIYVDLIQIMNVDEKDGLWTVKLWVYYYYFTESLHWNSSDYDGIETLVVPPDTFWNPDIG